MKKAEGLLAVDVDGTLITDHGSITDDVYRALERADSMGWEIVIASGRTYYAAKPITDKLPFLRYAVMSNGACIMDMRDIRVVHMEKLHPKIVGKVVRVTREKGAIPALYTTDVLDQSLFYDTTDGACEYFIGYVQEDPRAVRIDDVLDHVDDVLQIGMIAERDIIFSISEVLDGIDATVMTLPFESASLGIKTREYWFIQVIARNARKNIALRKIAELLEIPSGRLVAVGDNYNDADMIEGADIGIAMGNAPDEVKELAQVVVASNNCSGLAEVVDEVILSGKYFS